MQPGCVWRSGCGGVAVRVCGVGPERERVALAEGSGPAVAILESPLPDARARRSRNGDAGVDRAGRRVKEAAGAGRLEAVRAEEREAELKAEMAAAR